MYISPTFLFKVTAEDGTLIVPPRKLSPAFQDRKDVKEVCVLCSPACLPELISPGLCSWGNNAPIYRTRISWCCTWKPTLCGDWLLFVLFCVVFCSGFMYPRLAPNLLIAQASLELLLVPLSPLQVLLPQMYTTMAGYSLLWRRQAPQGWCETRMN